MDQNNDYQGRICAILYNFAYIIACEEACDTVYLHPVIIPWFRESEQKYGHICLFDILIKMKRYYGYAIDNIPDPVPTDMFWRIDSKSLEALVDDARIARLPWWVQEKLGRKIEYIPFKGES